MTTQVHVRSSLLIPSLAILASLVHFLGVGVQAAEVDLKVFMPPLPRLDNLPRSAEDAAKVDLGRHLYYEKRISKDNTLSCNSCHDLPSYGVDGVDFSEGVGGQRVGRNSPTVYNAAMHIAQFWDGREPTVEEQAKGPILAAKEMSMPNPEMVISRLKAIPEYNELFKLAFPRAADPITYDHVGQAIGAFERCLTTPARFDSYLQGKTSALSADEKKGLEIFVKNSCTTCHVGTLLGGQMYQKAGLVKPWPNQADLGRFDVTKLESDKMMFKVPSLRNIEKTAPFFHDSSAKTLEEAVRLMGVHQLGLELTASDTKSLVAFLKSLTGELPAEFIAQQKLAGLKKANDFE